MNIEIHVYQGKMNVVYVYMRGMLHMVSDNSLQIIKNSTCFHELGL